MVSFSKNGSCYSLIFSQKEFNELQLNPEKDYELVKIKPGLWVFVEKEKSVRELDETLFSLLKKKSLSEKVEGEFEKNLSKEELLRFKQLLKEGKIIAFKLSPKYKKAVYKIAPKEKKESEKSKLMEKAIDEYCLEKDGFLIVANEERAKKLSEELKQQVKDGTIKGIRCFEGYFYIIENDLYEKYREPANKLIATNNNISLEELTKKLNISKTLTKIVCEFLKDEGEIIEKKKEQYQFVK